MPPSLSILLTSHVCLLDAAEYLRWRGYCDGPLQLYTQPVLSPNSVSVSRQTVSEFRD